jgi:hypothetical protein
MYKYRVKLNNKVYYYNGEHTDNIAVKMNNRKVFGNYFITNLRLKTYDAETRGKNWAEYEADGKTMMIERSDLYS